jgi:hypothetical protein
LLIGSRMFIRCLNFYHWWAGDLSMIDRGTVCNRLSTSTPLTCVIGRLISMHLNLCNLLCLACGSLLICSL